MSRSREKIMVALSGGVDSAVAALLLLREGYDVEALHMTNWEDDDGYCTAARDFQDARAVCADLGIPLHRVNFSKAYRDRVFAHFLDEYRAGRTPNPDILCNREIKFDLFLAHAERLGARRMATGHYAQVGEGPCLLRAADTGKDQTYFLHAVPGSALARSLFPVGELQKAQVREMATEAGLPVHRKRDSTGICFIGERPFRAFLRQYLAAPNGPMCTPEGEHVGEHEGLMYYTRGQRQGLGIGGLSGHDDSAWYVAGKHLSTNTLIVVQGHDHPALLDSELQTERAVWVGEEPAALKAGEALHCSAKTRYRQTDAACRVERRSAGLQVSFETPQWAITPGQSVVLYAGDACLGGAVIRHAGPQESALPAAAAAG